MSLALSQILLSNNQIRDIYQPNLREIQYTLLWPTCIVHCTRSYKDNLLSYLLERKKEKKEKKEGNHRKSYLFQVTTNSYKLKLDGDEINGGLGSKMHVHAGDTNLVKSESETSFYV